MFMTKVTVCLTAIYIFSGVFSVVANFKLKSHMTGQKASQSIRSSHIRQLMQQLKLAFTADLERIKAERRQALDPKMKRTSSSSSPLSSLSSLVDANLELTNPFVTEVEGEEPEETPGFFEGDMIYLPSQILSLKLALNSEKFQTRKWPNATVPYVISSKYAQSEVLMIEDAIRILNFVTCLRFEPWDGVAEDFLIIWPVSKPAGCYAFVGRIGGAQLVSLQPPDSESPRCFPSVGKPIHELMHSIGFFHEQSRDDRDNYIRVLDKNIIKRFKRNFIKHSPLNATADYTYDYGSVMHYGARFFSRDRSSPTILPLVNNTVIGQRNGLSVRDCLRINSYYGCFQRSPYHEMKYRMICRIMGRSSESTTDFL